MFCKKLNVHTVGPENLSAYPKKAQEVFLKEVEFVFQF